MVRWRGDATRLTERAGASLQSLFDQLGLVSREAYDELELRVAQLEHRLRLAERELERRAGRKPGRYCKQELPACVQH